MSNQNPFSTPISDIPTPAAAEPTVESDSIWPVAKRTFRAWEKLRLLYNGILIFICVAYAAAWSSLMNIEFWLLSIAGAIFCNACFLLGPIVETYVAWLGYRTEKLRLAFMIAGTLATAFVAIAVLTSLFYNAMGL